MIFVRMRKYPAPSMVAASSGSLGTDMTNCRIRKMLKAPVSALGAAVVAAGGHTQNHQDTQQERNDLLHHFPSFSKKFHSLSPVCEDRLWVFRSILRRLGRLQLELQAVRDQSYELTVCGLPLGVAHGIAEEALQGVQISPVPGDFDGVADGPFYP